MNDFLDIASLAMESLDSMEETTTAVPDKEGVALRFGIIGAGQAGGGFAAAFHRIGYQKVIYYNSTSRDDTPGLTLPPEHRLICETPRGGAGKNITLARSLLGQSEGALVARMSRIFGEVDRIFVCAALGGGTGCGSVAGIARLADTYLTSRGVVNGVSVIAALPTTAECAGAVVKANATEILAELANLSITLYVVDNDRVLQFFSRLTLSEVMPTANATLVQLLDVFNRTAASPSPFYSCDATDLSTVLAAPGLALLGATNLAPTCTQEDFVRAMTSGLRQKSLLVTPDALSSAAVGACVVLAPKTVLDSVAGIMAHVSTGWDALQQIMGSATLHRGLYQTKADTYIRVFTHVSGLSVPRIPRLG